LPGAGGPANIRDPLDVQFDGSTMIIGRSPLRISLGGGGTDLPSYYRQHGGFLVAAAIDQYVYVTLVQTPLEEIILRYSKIERVKKIDDIQHPIIREALRLTGVAGRNIEITSMADIPAGTGLGSSGSFGTCLLRVLHKFKRHFVHPRELAEMACHIEIDLLREPVGKQDQYIAAFGGATVFEFNKDDTVSARPVKASDETLDLLEDSLVMVSTGFYRAASQVLKEQDEKSRQNDRAMIDNLHYIKELGYKSLEAIETAELNTFGRLMHEHWQFKKQRSSLMTNPEIDGWYQLALDNGAVGGKLIGAGGGGFLLFYTEQKGRLRGALRRAGLMEVPISFDFEGTKIISS
jgi:D-glycero-alpha-D-manno-heptose-7-phosphate kinase